MIHFERKKDSKSGLNVLMTSFLVGFTNENMSPQVTKRTCEQHGQGEQNPLQAPLSFFHIHVKFYLKSYETPFVKVLAKSSAPPDRVVHMHVWLLVEACFHS